MVFVGDRTLAALHGRWLDDCAPTDVMAFDLRGDPSGPEGQIWVSVERARAVARAHDVPAADELALYVAHGVLHLCGHEDRSRLGRSRMRAAERRTFEALGRRRPPP